MALILRGSAFLALAVVLVLCISGCSAYHDDPNQWDKEQLLLWWPQTREYCLPVPSLSRMELIEPDDFVKVPGKDNCSEGDYAGHLIVSVLPALIMAALILAMCPCFGLAAAVAGLIPSKSPKRKQSAGLHIASFGMGVLLLIVIICGTTSLVGSDRLNSFAFEAQDIILDYPRFVINQVEGYPPTFVPGIIPSLLNLKYTNDTASRSVVAEQSLIAEKFKDHGEDNLAYPLTALRDVQEFWVALTYAALVIVVVGGLTSALLRMPRLAMFMAVCLWLLWAVVWMDLGAFWLANNSVHDLCEVVNGCHFCLVGLDGDKNCTKECNYPFFQTMDECPVKAANMFQGLYNLTSFGLTQSTNSSCAGLDTLCDSAKTPEVTNCTSPYSCTTANLAERGVSTMVLLQGQTEYQSVQSLASGSSSVSTLAQSILNETDILRSYSTVMDAVDTINCSTSSSYIGQWYQGFDALQRHFCPRLAEPQYTFIDLLTLTSAGFLLLGLLLPLGICCLTAHGLSRFGSVRSTDSAPDDYLLLNPSDADEANLLSGTPASLAWDT